MDYDFNKEWLEKHKYRFHEKVMEGYTEHLETISDDSHIRTLLDEYYENLRSFKELVEDVKIYINVKKIRLKKLKRINDTQ